MTKTSTVSSLHFTINGIVAETAKWAVFQSPYTSPAKLDYVLLILKSHLRNRPEFMSAMENRGDFFYMECAFSQHTSMYAKMLSVLRKVFNRIPELMAWGTPKNIDSSNPHDRDSIDIDALLMNVARNVVNDSGYNDNCRIVTAIQSSNATESATDGQ